MFPIAKVCLYSERARNLLEDLRKNFFLLSANCCTEAAVLRPIGVEDGQTGPIRRQRIMARGVCTRDFFHLEDFPLIMKSGLPFF